MRSASSVNIGLHHWCGKFVGEEPKSLCAYEEIDPTTFKVRQPTETAKIRASLATAPAHSG